MSDIDALDVCEFGEHINYVGRVKPVKVHGITAFLDEGNSDRKIVTVEVTNPPTNRLNDIEHLDRLFLT